MLILGFYGGPNTEFEIDSPTQTHDGAAVLLKDGEVVAAIEEERLNRIKHSYTAPLRAARFVMEQAGVTLADIDHIAIPYLPQFAERLLRRMYLADPSAVHALDVTDTLRAQWRQYLGADVPRDRLHFIPHHIAHATATFEMSGFDDALVMTIDGQGETESGLTLKGSASGLELLRRVPIPESLGHFYWQAIGFLGYRLFDEYKVMGLAPYGDPERFRPQFEEMCQLLPDGHWQLRPHLLDGMYATLTPRRKGDPLEQIHKDFAAALQQTVERAVMHALTHFRLSTGLRNLCLGGGVAHNCTMNGNILRSGLFDDVFVHPAAHDGGNALGAALSVYRSVAPQGKKSTRLRNVYWGSDIGQPEAIETALRAWSDFVEIVPSVNVEEDTAAMIGAGQVVGWVQGRSEFGPRALGNRSILADPRPSENKSLINKMIKTRESFRPFAPAVLEEHASEYFELPAGQTQFPFMTFVLNVQPDKRQLLGAVTHVDGTARVQTVSATESPRFWRLIDAFRRRTGVPVILNTSFNNNVEPIVDSVEDALACFLTTGLHALVVGDFILTKKEGADRSALIAELPNHVRLLERRQRTPGGEMRDLLEIRRALWNGEASKALSNEIYSLLKHVGGGDSIADLATAAGLDPQPVMAIMEELWAERYVLMRPRAGVGRIPAQPQAWP
ncbi:carbamoyltransferase C-terminal domain-containing protein [Xanthomonas sacchari]|uniref:carbamoyltransferase family protein n=1 Tax=Xanthomonas sacchari TaxID=56458 RepID=UPI00225A2ECB|nr:carbamoyltransferase C-terminal domain-containing protein [Xanthomonas sacchari]MCW0447202.1 Decarbamoylnovobiocin carbamoyltransferase [Xanthomonas sacchari]MCW0452914.1 Decarbamoylnovobiocin carbamoyltransferase [Xanthomonas sacchari]UYK78662.1 nodulation protein [Xanthomonas sacchari]